MANRRNRTRGAMQIFERIIVHSAKLTYDRIGQWCQSGKDDKEAPKAVELCEGVFVAVQKEVANEGTGTPELAQEIADNSSKIAQGGQNGQHPSRFQSFVSPDN